jgi:hypothetical protein
MKKSEILSNWATIGHAESTKVGIYEQAILQGKIPAKSEKTRV